MEKYVQNANHARISQEFQQLNQSIESVVQAQMQSIIQGNITIGFGEFGGMMKLINYKNYREQFIFFVMHVRGIIRIK